MRVRLDTDTGGDDDWDYEDGVVICATAPIAMNWVHRASSLPLHWIHLSIDLGPQGPHGPCRHKF